jgi:hypothetical protein
MEKNDIHVNGVFPATQPNTGEIVKELAQLRARLAEVASTMRGAYGRENVEVRLTQDVAAAVQRLEARLLNCPTAQFE